MIAKLKAMVAHRFAPLAIALLVGFVSYFPQILTVKNLGAAYAGIPFIYQANEDAYIARIREVAEGHWAVGSAFFYEYKNWIPVVPSVGEIMYGWPAWLGLPLISVIQSSKFILPALLFWLVYSFILQLSNDPQRVGSRLNALVGGLVVCLGYDLVDFRFLLELLRNPANFTALSVWTRPINPISGALLIFCFLNLLLWLLNSRRFRYGVLAGLVWAAMIGYVFSWTFTLVFWGLLTAVYAYKKDYSAVKLLFFTFLIWLLATMPYWWQVGKMFLTHVDGGALSKSGLVYMRTPVINKIVAAASLLFGAATFYVARFKKDEPIKKLWWQISAVLLLTGWVVFNQQLITGRSVWYHHYVQYTIPAAMVVFMLVLNNWVKPLYPKIWLSILIALLALIAAFNLAALRTFKYKQAEFAKLQTLAPVFSWVEANTPPECVILNQDYLQYKIDTLIPAFTHCNVYAPSWVFDGVPADRVWHNYLVMLRLRQVEPGAVRAYLEDHDREVREYFFSDWDQLFSPAGGEYFAGVKDRLAQDYQKFTLLDFSTQLKKFRLDYLLLVSDPNPALLQTLPQLKAGPLFKNINFAIYKF